MNKVVWLVCLAIGMTVLGCNQKSSTPNPVENTAKKQSSDVIKIVFVGQKQACECTRDRIDATWKSLQAAVGKDSNIVVERIQLDVHEEQADKLDEQRSLMVAPGIYFIDMNENIVEMLQGELSADQISKVL